MKPFRYVNEAAGAMVLLAAAVLVAAALQAGVLHEWLSPSATLRILLPSDGSAGLSTGAAVEILGIRAGDIRRIVVNPDESLYAEARITNDMERFVRRDSKALIRKQFGIAGASYIEITRGQEAPLDWSFAVIEAASERPATENVGQLLDDVRGRIFPIIQQTEQTLRMVNVALERIDRGEGTAGRLLSDDRLIRSLEDIASSVDARVGDLQPVMADVGKAVNDAATLTGKVAGQSSAVAAAIENVAAISASLRTAAAQLARAAPAAATAVRNVDQASTSLPALLAQTQTTTLQLERLLAQLRGMWLLGGAGGSAPPPEAMRLPPGEAR